MTKRNRIRNKANAKIAFSTNVHGLSGINQLKLKTNQLRLENERYTKNITSHVQNNVRSTNNGTVS